MLGDHMIRRKHTICYLPFREKNIVHGLAKFEMSCTRFYFGIAWEMQTVGDNKVFLSEFKQTLIDFQPRLECFS